MDRDRLYDLIDEWASDILDEDIKKETETHRWIFCLEHNGKDWDTDCGCCLMHPEEKKEYRTTCGCRCHKRIWSLVDYLIQNGARTI